MAGASRIADEYEASDRRRYWVPCPHCDVPQVLRWQQVRWNSKLPTVGVAVNLRVSDRTGRSTYSRVYSVEGQVPSLQIMGGDNAQLSLEDGLRRLSRAVAEDAELSRALVALPVPPSAPEPAPTAPGRRRGRVTS